jgi:hypothetical protein
MHSEDAVPVNDDQLKHSVREELRHFSKEFYMTSIQHHDHAKVEEVS